MPLMSTQEYAWEHIIYIIMHCIFNQLSKLSFIPSNEYHSYIIMSQFQMFPSLGRHFLFMLFTGRLKKNED